MTNLSPPRRIALRYAVGVASLALIGLPFALDAQNVVQQGWNPKEVLAKETYVKPPEIVERIVTAPRNNVAFTNPSPDKRYFLKTESEGLASIDAFGKPHYRLAGVEIDYKANRARALTTRGGVGLTLLDPNTGAIAHDRDAEGRAGERRRVVAGRQERSATSPTSTRRRTSSSPTSRPANRCRSRRRRCSPRACPTFEWTADGKNIITVLLPDNRPRRAEASAGRDGAARPHQRSRQGAAEPQLREPAARSSTTRICSTTTRWASSR